MEANNIILNLPFDESNGSNVAYDYSKNRADVQVHSASFVPGRNGNAIKFTGSEYGEVTKQIFSNLNAPFTITLYVQSLEVETGTPTAFVWGLNFDGLNNYIEVPIEANPKMWFGLALVRQGTLYNFFVNGQLVKTLTQAGTLQGVSLNQDYYGGEYGLCLLDDVKLYDIALTQEELLQTSSVNKQQSYTLDGIDFREFGVFVSDSDGVLNRPKLKQLASISWDNYHGEDVDLNHKYYEPREITLSCFIKAKTKNDFIMQMSRFEQQFDKRGLHRLMIDVHPIKPLIYEVYCKDEISVSKKWNDELMVGTFKLKLTEPQPVKRVLKHIRISETTKSCTINITTPKYVNIFWGDGTVDEDISGRDVQVSHNYKENGEYFPVITGCIDEIEAFQTNAIIVWNKL
uniref:Distal tail protein n=1 Tax=Siphoviridae sp. cttm829 TaxID=2825707 RepID=A0A8S5PGN7_9CAUD|nr:MAG TPA: distal tail protein [Siphoviridae sp. cttm829]